MRRLLLCAGLLAACTSDAPRDLGTISDGKGDSSLVDVEVTLPAGDAGSPGTQSFTVHSGRDFDVRLTYDGMQATKILVTSDAGTTSASDMVASPTVTVSVGSDTSEHAYTLKLENFGPELTARLTASAHDSPVSVEVLAAAKANLARVAKEIDADHLSTYGFSGAEEDQFLRALSAEYESQHPDQYVARVKALASMAFFELPDVAPPADGKLTPFNGLNTTQMDALSAIEDSVFNQLIANNGGQTNGVRPFSVCETRFIIDTFARPAAPYPGFTAYHDAYAAYAKTCPQKDLDEWYDFRGLGGLRPSWVESNLADRFLRRMVKNCAHPSSSWTSECAQWRADRFGYRQLRNRQLAARTMYYAPDQESYLIDPNNPLVFLEDRNGDNVGEFLRPGPITLPSGEQGTLQVTSTSQFAGELHFQPASGASRTITPKDLPAEQAVDPRWNGTLLANADLGLMTVFATPTGCTGSALDPSQCPLLRRFYSMIDRHENFYQTFSALTPTYYGISSQPSPLVACSITLGAAQGWDSAGTPAGGSAGFIFLMRVPFADIITGNDVSVATLMPGPKTTSIQSLYAGNAHLDFRSAWLDVASLSNNQYESEHEVSAFGAVPASEIEGILVVRKPAAVP